MKPRTVVLLAALSAFGPLLATLAVGARPFTLSGTAHCVGVGLGAAFATLAAYAVTAVGVRRGDARTVLVGVAFAAMGAILAVHGLVTPGILVENTNLSPITGGSTVPVGAAVLALGTIPGFAVPARIPLLLRASVLISGVVLAASIIGLLDPALVPRVPAARSTGAIALLVIGGACLLLVTVRAARTWLLTRRSSDLAVVAGVAWLGAALVGATLFRYDQLGWWLGHGFEIAALALVGTTVALDLRRTAASRPLTGDLPATALVRDAEAFLGARVSSLLLDLQRADRSTGEHTRRVALNAVLVGEALDSAAAACAVWPWAASSTTSASWACPSPSCRSPVRWIPRSGPRSSGTRHWARRCSTSSAASDPTSDRSSSTTTSGPTAVATRAAWRATSCRSTRASSRCATCSTRWSRSGPIARHGRSSGRWRPSPKAPGRSSTRAACRR